MSTVRWIILDTSVVSVMRAMRPIIPTMTPVRSISITITDGTIGGGSGSVIIRFITTQPIITSILGLGGHGSIIGILPGITGRLLGSMIGLTAITVGTTRPIGTAMFGPVTNTGTVVTNP